MPGIEKKNIHNNRLQVINQYEVSQEQGAKHDNRYDVTVLVNGLPLVHIELKRRGVAIREAFNQINRYQRDSFWAGGGLFEYVQIFVISNGTNTKYYSNSTRFNAIREASSGKTKKQKTSNSFEFTSFWADANNKVIPDLIDFTRTFFARHTLLNVLTRYCIFTSENMLMVMRPYQITATERILNRIEIANNYKKYGTIQGGGYIWHTTGSGKTLTSFKTARLASQLNYIDKVLFVVDRKDLDYQTMKEYDRFEKGAANSNTSTAILKKQLEDDNAHIIITTIQKLSTFIKKYPAHEVYQKHVVIIFDECHRSQFGDMHTAIVKNFKKYHLFGFTGTPIFAANARAAGGAQFFTTAQTFGDQLHTYTIVDAINDKNVLPFRVDYIQTMDAEPDIDDKAVWDIDREKAFMAPERIELVTRYILEHFDQKTYRGDKTYLFNTLTNIAEVASGKNGAVEEIKQKQRLSGFNSIFAVASVDMAKLYYQEFQKQMAADPTKKLRVATIYSYGANEEETDGILDEENSEDTSALDQNSRDFLDAAIRDYLKKSVKAQVDAIVDELAKVPEVAECYEQWNRLRDELERYYKDSPREHLPLSQQKEFKAIKNMVIREAERLRLGTVTFEDARMRDEVDEDQDAVYFAWNSDWRMAEIYQSAKEVLEEYENPEEEKAEQVRVLEQLWQRGFTLAAYQLGKCWRDGRGVLPDDQQAELWFRRAADAGYDFAQYALGKFLQSQNRTEEAVSWYEKAAAQGNSCAAYRLGKLYLEGKDVPKDVPKAVDYLTFSAEQGNQYAQYTLGNLYLTGQDVKQDREQAWGYFYESAEQGNEYAAFFLKHFDQARRPNVFLSATRLLHHLSQIFRDNSVPPAAPVGQRVDRKLRRKIQEKKIAMGHKPDDHEETPRQDMGGMTMGW